MLCQSWWKKSNSCWFQNNQNLNLSSWNFRMIPVIKKNTTFFGSWKKNVDQQMGLRRPRQMQVLGILVVDRIHLCVDTDRHNQNRLHKEIWTLSNNHHKHRINYNFNTRSNFARTSKITSATTSTNMSKNHMFFWCLCIRYYVKQNPMVQSVFGRNKSENFVMMIHYRTNFGNGTIFLQLDVSCFVWKLLSH